MILAVGRGASTAGTIADAVGVGPQDVLLARPLGRQLLLAWPGPVLLARLVQALRQQPSTVLHLLEFKSALALLAIALRRLFPGKVRLVHSAFGQLSTLDPARPVNRWLCRAYFACVDRVLVQSADEARSVRELAARFDRPDVDVHQLPLAVLDAPEPSQAAGGADRVRPGPPTRAMFLGRVVSEKGVLETLSLVARLAPLGGPRQLTLYGPRQSSGYEAAIEQAAELARAQGLVCQRREVGDPAGRYGLYREADVFVMLPTVKEESSLATIEALTTGCKVLLNANCVIPHMDEFPSLIRLLQPGDNDTALLHWLQAPACPEELARLRDRFIARGKADLLRALDR